MVFRPTSASASKVSDSQHDIDAEPSAKVRKISMESNIRPVWRVHARADSVEKMEEVAEIFPKTPHSVLRCTFRRERLNGVDRGGKHRASLVQNGLEASVGS